MDVVTDPQLHSEVSRLYTLPLKHHKLVQNEVEDLEKTVIIQRNLLPYACVVVFPQKTLPGCPPQEIKRLCIDYCQRYLEMKLKVPVL